MTTVKNDYLHRSGQVELDRLRLQARVWEPEAETMLDHIGVEPGWRCIDLGRGGIGILEPLSRRVGASGHVAGVDIDPLQLATARTFVAETELSNVEILERDAYDTRLPHEAFDLVHARFLFAPLGQDQALLREMLVLVRPGGVVAIQEPDANVWNCFPPNVAWDRLKSAILAAFAQSGGDFSAGQRTYDMLRDAGLEDVRARAAVLALHDRHPYLRLPIQFRHRCVSASWRPGC